MSLQVWLPLTKDLRQQGLSDISAAFLGSATFSDSGKLGKSLYNSTNNDGVTLNGYLTNLQSFTNYSMSAWIFLDSQAAGHSSSIISAGNWNTGAGQLCFALYDFAGTDSGYRKLLVPNTSGWSNGINLTNWIKLNTWYHLTITYNGIKTIGYVNGEKVGEYNGGGIGDSFNTTNLYIGRATYTTSFTTKGKINDVRIYDHCLSPMEVKQISQGLVLHYPLNRQGWGQENLLKNSHIKLDNNGYYVGTYSFANSEEIVTGETYTLSFNGELQDDSQTGWYFNIFPSPYAAIINKSTDKEGRFAFSFVMPENDGKHTAIGCYSTPLGNRLGCAIWNVKLEKGSISTPWCPNSADALATTMGLNSTIEYDCSGFCNNGIWHGIHTNTSDTPKYAVSTTATGSGTTYLEGPILPAEAKTVALWIKNTSKSSNGAIFNDKTTGLQIGLLNSLLYMNSKTSTAGFTTTHWVNGEWNHVVAVNNNGTRSLYVNGQAETQSGASNYYIHNADNCWLWNRSYNNNYPFTGSLCDLRVYATALSADDVKSLYQNCATIDPDGTIRGQIRS